MPPTRKARPSAMTSLGLSGAPSTAANVAPHQADARPDAGTHARTDARPHARTRVNEPSQLPPEIRRAVDVEGRRYAAAARKLADRETELGRIVDNALAAGATGEQVAVWLRDVLDQVPASVRDRLDQNG